MAVAVIAVPSADNANSYIDVAAFDAYCNDRLNATAGTSATEDDKGRAVIEATRELDVLLWHGRRKTDTQSLSWPRQGVKNPDAPHGADFPSNVIPKRVQEATAELALQFLKAGASDIASLDPNAGVIRKRVDVLETEWAAPQQRKQGLARFPRVAQLIAPLIESTAGQIRLVRG